MKRKLPFLIALLTINIGVAQDVIKQYENFDVGTNLDYSLIGLNKNIVTMSEVVIQYNSIQNKDFIISPNPGKSELNIKLPSHSQDLKLEVFDVLGKRVYKGVISRLESSVNISNWKNGVYLVRVSSTKITHTKRFIKQ